MKNFITLLMTVIFSLSLNAQDKIYVHTATADNINGNRTEINHPELNGNPDARLVIVHRYEGVYNNHVTGVYYDAGHWRIFNEDSSPMVEGTKYNIYLSDPENYIVHTATGLNTDIFITYLDSSIGESDYIFSTNFWDGVYNNFTYSTAYSSSTSQRYLYHTAFLVDVPSGAKFMVLKDRDISSSMVYTHVTESSNINAWVTYLDHPLLNGKPDAAFIFQHYFNAPGTSGTDNEIGKVLSTWYDPTVEKWTIYTEDLSAMPAGLAFDICIAEREILATDDVQQEFSKISLYPNPAVDMVSIASSKENIQAVEIYDVSGKMVQSFKDSGKSVSINVSALPSGMYIAKVLTDEGWFSKKLIKK